MTSFRKNIASNFTTMLLQVILGIGVSILVARALGPEGMGIVTFTLMVISLIATYGNFGILNAHTYFFVKKKEYKKESVFQNNITVGIIISFLWILIISILMVSGYLYGNFDVISTNNFVIFFIILAIPVIMISTTLSNTLFVLEKIILQNKIILTTRIIYVIILTLLVYLKQLTISIYLISYVLFEFSVLILYFLSIKIPFKFYLNKLLIRQEFKFGVQIFLAALFIYLTYRVDIFLIAYFTNFTEVGIYSIGVVIAEQIIIIPTSIAIVLYSRILNMSEGPENKHLTFITTKFSFFICFLLMLPLFIFAPLAVNILYGLPYVRSVLIIQLLLPGVLFAVIGKIIANYYIAQGKPIIHTSITFFSFLLNIILNFILIPKYGIIGAAIASTITYIIYGVFYLILITRREKKNNFLSFFYLNMEDISIIKNLLPKFLHISKKDNKNKLE